MASAVRESAWRRHRCRRCLTARPGCADWHLGWGAGAPQGHPLAPQTYRCPACSDTLNAPAVLTPKHPQACRQLPRLPRSWPTLDYRADRNGPARTRTWARRIMSPLLYRLSYRARCRDGATLAPAVARARPLSGRPVASRRCSSRRILGQSPAPPGRRSPCCSRSWASGSLPTCHLLRGRPGDGRAQGEPGAPAGRRVAPAPVEDGKDAGGGVESDGCR